MLKIYNKLSRKKEEFVPITPNVVKIYGCGVTPYKPAHLGHAMQAIIFDVIRRYFEYKGYKTTYVRNSTDIEDKIIEKAKEFKMEPLEYSKMIIKQEGEDLRKLRVRIADFEPKVSEYIPQIISAVQKLIDTGFAYTTEKRNVYFDISKFPTYGKLSRQKLDKTKIGTRKEVEEDKKNSMDFALWKSSKDEEISWDSPWGKGRPGWHIECSVMSTCILGPHFDIHGGGMDLVFPHHENEIAQSESLNNGQFVNYWVYNGLLMVGTKKMSKSLSNDIDISTWLERYHPEVIRYLILTNHYRSHVQFVPERYVEATKKVYQAYKGLKLGMEYINGTEDLDQKLFDSLMRFFEDNMDNDFNTVPVIAKYNELINEINSVVIEKGDTIKVATYIEFIQKTGGVIGLFDLNPADVLNEIEDLYILNLGMKRDEISRLLEQRNEFRKNKEYEKADGVRNNLLKKGITVLDTPSGSTWELAF
ncbi:cysteine--tRNA ligase [Candidatus Dojkabacteria bacterium]|jgi:cysteinyl-tRNA synthetase|nr:cysteine--tRNA ligase [Candidatus Dojkabacteria bacterium]